MTTVNHFSIGPVPKETSFKYTGILYDDSVPPVVIPAASLTTLTMTLRDVNTKAIINSRDKQDILNVNGVTVDSSGNLTWEATPADSPIIGVLKNGQTEQHEAQIVWTWNSGAKQGAHKILISVEQYDTIL